MMDILFGIAIGIAMSASILGAYRWMVWRRKKERVFAAFPELFEGVVHGDKL